jgi:hypothetical protein
MTLKDQVKEFVEFDESIHLSERANWGRSLENNRLAPLLNLLPEIVEALEKIDRICMASNDLRGTDIHCHASIKLFKIKEVVACEESGEKYDPTPWCHICSSTTIAGCDCGPIAEND